jgi:hypothetical protein
VRGVGQIGHRIQPFINIIQVAIKFAVTGRAAHIGSQNGEAILGEMLDEKLEEGLELPLGTAMNKNLAKPDRRRRCRR